MKIDHVAHPCHDPHETHRFYATMLGLQLVQAYAGEELMLVYALPDGGSLAFTTQKPGKPPSTDTSDWQVRHVGLTVSTRAEFDKWLQRLKEFGVPHQLVDNERIYFSDPDGMVLEIEAASPMPVDSAASEILARWQRDH